MLISGVDVQPVEIDGVQWLTAQDAAAVLTANSGHKISPDYPRRLASPNCGKLESKSLHGKMNVYRLEQVQAYKVAKGPGRRKKPKPKPGPRRQAAGRT